MCTAVMQFNIAQQNVLFFDAMHDHSMDGIVYIECNEFSPK